ncbi:MAG: PQQ-binding-like beta-propeller repeat protein [Thermoguttaceae bacterium]|jgi:outer membrane protein assembly factor BamB|nr:PQQ-binding-like beta-propeller repeat protein [Thermoguttaceae bacterium]
MPPAPKKVTMLPNVLALLAVGALALWLGLPGGQPVDARVPGLDRQPLLAPSATDEVAAAPKPGSPRAFDGKPSAIPGAWPCFRGPNRDAIYADPQVRLARRWPPEGPKVLWSVNLLGPGHAGAAVADGRVYVLDYDVQAEADTIRCFSLDDGREIWRNGYPVPVSENHGMSRTVPAVFGDYVVTLGPKCHLACWDAKTGQCRWLVDLVQQFRAKVPSWYAGQCPLIDEGRVIVAPCGEVFMAALECSSGQIVWKTPRLHHWEMTHVSIAPLEFSGRRIYVYCGSGGVAGVSARDGAVLWETTEWVGKMATCPTPVPVGEGKIFLCSGYSAGSMMLKLDDQSGRIVPKVLWRLKPKQFESEQHTPVFYQGHLFGIGTAAGGKLACLDLEGNQRWDSGARKFGRGPYCVANGMIYALSDEGLLVMAEATPEAYRPLGQFQVFERATDAWAPMALVAGRLILRDLTRMVCLDLRDQ